VDWVIAIPVVIFVLLLLVFVGRIVKYRGATGALFKARITRTLGSFEVCNTSSLKLRIKVHALEKAEPGWVGVEFERFNGDSWQNSPLTLSRTEARRLSELLAQAAQAA
jgi:hypothetical protein